MTIHYDCLCDDCARYRYESRHEPVPCPECNAGKHCNCDGTAWDNQIDEIGPCPCYEAGHE